MTQINIHTRQNTKKSRMAQIKEEVENLTTSPLYPYRLKNNYHPVIGAGNTNADLMFIGEAPGEKEALIGNPFVGRAGQVLDELLISINLNRSKVYITNIVKDRPPGNRDPNSAEIELYAPFLIEQINIIHPKTIITLGRFAMNFILKQFSLSEYGCSIGELHGQVLQAETKLGEIMVVPMYHPAARFYNRGLEETQYQDFSKLSQFI
jgi:uracil-DNA glycosylase